MLLQQVVNRMCLQCLFPAKDGFTGGVRGGGGGGVHPLALARGGAIFRDKQKIIRGQNEIQ
jgi:hypothetical protein